MKRIALAFAVAVVATAAAPRAFAQFKVVGYSTSWSGEVGEIPFAKLTHVNYAFVIPNGDGSVGAVPNPGKLGSLVSAAHARGRKVLIAVGGWNDGNDSGFETLAASAAGRSHFISSMMNIVDSFGLDGVDIDWEYPDPGNSAENHRQLMQQLCSTLHARGKLCTAAVVALGWSGGGILSPVFGYVDFLNLMAYDGGAGADHSPYSYAVQSLDYWVSQRGLPASKAVLGVPFYGRPSWESYRAIVARDPGAPNRDLSNGVFYNGLQTIRDKTRLALQRGGGVMFWEASQDTTSNATSLLHAVSETIGGPQPSPGPSPLPSPSPSPGTCTTPAWDRAQVYVGGSEAAHRGRLWRARWWTQGEEPGVAQVWEDRGPCGGPTPSPSPQPSPSPSPGPSPSPSPSPSPQPGDAWQPNTNYAAGQVVTHSGSSYVCLQAHRSLPGWEPPNVPALWRRR